MSNEKKTGVLLLNLGGPEKSTDVAPFLFNLFSDRQIIRLGPRFLQKFIAYFIAKRRAPKSIANYNKIGGGSPIRRISEGQAKALEKALADDGDYMVRVCMRYWHPFATQVLQEMAKAGVEEIIALPLYPHYSIATTGSSLLDLRRTIKKLKLNITLREIVSWPREPNYIRCLSTLIHESVKKFKGKPPHIVYSAHSLPLKFIEEGDPYVKELKQTITALESNTGLQGQLCYQSRSGPVEWLGPATPDVIEELAQQDCKNILVIPVSFVSDHVETLYEINMQYREQAQQLGLRFECTPGLNTAPLFISGLRNLVLNNR